MKALTKDQVRLLAPEDQEAYGIAVAQDLQRRQDLLAQARPSPWLHAVDGVAYMAILGAAIWPNWRDGGMFALILLLSFTQWQTARINRRLDALSKLVEPQELDVHPPVPVRSSQTA